MRFKEFLDEYERIKTSSDQDFPFSNDIPALVFNPDEIYIKEGITHGLFSHAVKHFKEYLKGYESFIFKTFINILKSYKGNYYLVLFNKSGKVTRLLKKNFDIKDVQLETLLTTLDIIQDKIETMKGPLTDIEKEIYEKIKNPICKEYEDVARKILAKAYPIDNKLITLFNKYAVSNDPKLKDDILKIKKEIDKVGIVKFDYVSRNRPSTLVYNFNDTTLIVLTDREKTLLSMYKMIKSPGVSLTDSKNALLRKYDIQDFIKIYLPGENL